MSKIAGYLASHLRGEVLSNEAVINNLSTDGSVLRAKPILAVYPYDTSDLRKTAHFAWQLAGKGHVLPLITRGGGTNRVGGAIGTGAIISMPTHFSTIFEIDTKQKLVRLQPGIQVASLQQAMHTHGLEWPVDATHPTSTVGGAIANNTYGARALSYGDTSEWVDKLEVILSNGDVIQTEKLSKRQLSRKKGLSTFEGELYRKLDALIEDNEEIISGLAQKQTSAGYAIGKVKDRKGNFNLTPLIAGSQGTLGIIGEAILKLDVLHPNKEAVAIIPQSLDTIDELVAAVIKCAPDKVEFFDAQTLDRIQPNLSAILPDDEPDAMPQGLLFLQFSDVGRKAKARAKKAAKIVEKQGHQTAFSNGDPDSAAEIWQVYQRLSTAIVLEGEDHKYPVPLVEDALLPPTEVVHFIEAAHKLAKEHRTKLVASAHLATGVVRAYVLLDLKNLSDRNKTSKLVDEYYKLVLKHDGGIAGEYGEGRARATQNNLQFTQKEQDLFVAIKNIFDSYSIFNPGVKLPGEKDTAKLDEDFDPGKYSNNLPRL